MRRRNSLPTHSFINLRLNIRATSACVTRTSVIAYEPGRCRLVVGQDPEQTSPSPIGIHRTTASKPLSVPPSDADKLMRGTLSRAGTLWMRRNRPVASF